MLTPEPEQADAGRQEHMALTIDEFNALDATHAAATVSAWAAAPSWVDAIVARRPYSSVDALAATAAALTESWGAAELDAALAHHPRIGQPPAGSGDDAAASRREQASMSAADDAVAARIADGNARYEARFGRIFLIRAAGRSPEEMLSELERRLRNDPESEIAEATAQLAEIALLRLRETICATPEGRPR